MRYVIFLICMLVANQVLSDMRCSTNSLGTTTCRGNDGQVIKSRTNSLGITTYTDNNGNNVRARTNSLGTTTYTGNNGLRGTSRTNSLGITTYKDNKGNITFKLKYYGKGTIDCGN